MSTLFTTAWTVAAWTALHFLWIGLGLGLAGYVWVRGSRRRGPWAEYAATLGVLVLLAATPLAIAAYLAVHSPWPSGAGEPPAAVTSAAGWEGTEAGPIEISGLPPETAGRMVPMPSVADVDRMPLDDRLREAAVAAGPPAGRSEGRPSEPAGAAEAPWWSGRWWALRRALDALLGWLPAFWLAGSGSLLLLHGSGLTVHRRLRREARPVDDPQWLAALVELAWRLGLRRPPLLATHGGVAGPVLVGLVRPMILIPPAALSGWSPREIELILAHELVHLCRRDHLVHFFQRLAETAYFFHPCIWWYSHRLRRLREFCVDDQVVTMIDDRRQYAVLLARVAQGHRAPTVLAAEGLPMAEGPLVVRIRRLLTGEGEAMRLTRWQLAGGLGTVSMGLLAIALALSTGWPSPPGRQVLAGAADQGSSAVDRPGDASTAGASAHGEEFAEPFSAGAQTPAGDTGGANPFRIATQPEGRAQDEPAAAEDPFGGADPEKGAGQEPAGSPFGSRATTADEDDHPSSGASGHLAQVPRERLRYDGKTFSDWREELLTELKPERRLEAAKAFVRFAPYGYQTEALDALLSLARGYEWGTIDGSPDGQLQQIILQHLGSTDPALLVDRFRHIQESDNVRLKRLAAYVAWTMGKSAEPLVPMLMDFLTKEKDTLLRKYASQALSPFVRENPDVRRALEQALADPAVHDVVLVALYGVTGEGGGPGGYGSYPYGVAFGSAGATSPMPAGGGYGPVSTSGYGLPAGTGGYGGGGYGYAMAGYGGYGYGAMGPPRAWPTDPVRHLLQQALEVPRDANQEWRRGQPAPDALIEAILAVPKPNIAMLRALLRHAPGSESTIDRLVGELSGDDPQRGARALEALVVLGSHGGLAARRVAGQLASTAHPERFLRVLGNLPSEALRQGAVRRALEAFGGQLERKASGENRKVLGALLSDVLKWADASQEGSGAEVPGPVEP